MRDIAVVPLKNREGACDVMLDDEVITLRVDNELFRWEVIDLAEEKLPRLNLLSKMTRKYMESEPEKAKRAARLAREVRYQIMDILGDEPNVYLEQFGDKWGITHYDYPDDDDLYQSFVFDEHDNIWHYGEKILDHKEADYPTFDVWKWLRKYMERAGYGEYIYSVNDHGNITQYNDYGKELASWV